MLSVHYRHPINYNEELLENAKAGLERIKTSYENLKHRKKLVRILTDHNKEWLEKIEELHEAFD